MDKMMTRNRFPISTVVPDFGLIEQALQEPAATSIQSGGAIYDSINDFTYTAAAGNVISISDPGFTVNRENILGISYWNGSQWTHVDLNTISVAAGSDYDITFGEDTFVGTETFLFKLNGPEKAYDYVAGVYEYAVTNPVYAHKDEEKKTGTASSTAQYIDGNNFSSCSLDIDISAGSLEIEVSNDYETAVASITKWETVPGGSVSADTFLKVYGPYRHIRINPTAATFTIYVKQVFGGE
jgi:hypothetical protein